MPDGSSPQPQQVDSWVHETAPSPPYPTPSALDCATPRAADSNGAILTSYFPSGVIDDSMHIESKTFPSPDMQMEETVDSTINQSSLPFGAKKRKLDDASPTHSVYSAKRESMGKRAYTSAWNSTTSPKIPTSTRRSTLVLEEDCNMAGASFATIDPSDRPTILMVGASFTSCGGIESFT